MNESLPSVLTTLGHPQRLAVFRLLMRRHPDRVPAGEIADALALKPSTLSAYLVALKQAGLLVQDRVGTSLRYGVAMPAVSATLGALFVDCFGARPDLFAALAGDAAPNLGTDQKHGVLFLCTGNSARSLFAEALLRDLAGDRFAVYSGGTHPQDAPNPHTLAVLQAHGHDTTLLRSKSVDQFRGPDAPHIDFVFTVCDRAANEDCPVWPDRPVTGHWGIADPVASTGSDASVRLAFEAAYGQMKRRIAAFVALPFETLDRAALQQAVDTIAEKDQA